MKKISTLCLGFMLCYQSNSQSINYVSPIDITDATNVTFDGNPFKVLSQVSIPAGISFNPDGTRMFVIGIDGVLAEITQYSLSTSYDINSVISNLGSTSSIASQSTFPQDVAFNADGSKMFIVGSVQNELNQYTLSSPYNILTPSFDGSSPISISSPVSIAFNTDGTKLFVLEGLFSKTVVQYSLSTPYIVTSGVTQDGSFGVSSQNASARGIAFNALGTKMFITDEGSFTSSNVNQYSLSTPFDVTSGVTFDGSPFSIISEEGNPTDIAFNSTGTKMFILGLGDDEVNQYSLNSNVFREPMTNDGSVNGSLGITIEGEVFNNARSTLSAGGNDYAINNLPPGLIPNLAVSSDGLSAILTFSGNAANSNDINDIADLQFTFQNSAFAGGNAASVSNAIAASSNLGIDFFGDTTPPTIEILNAPSIVNNTSPFNVTFEFSENVTDFIETDISIGNGSTGNFQVVDGNTYTADITPDGNGNVAINVAANLAQDAAGNNNEAASQVIVLFDNTPPTVEVLNAPTAVNSTSPFNVTFEFSENVTGFTGGITVLNGSSNNFQIVDENTYTANIIPNGSGNITIEVASGSAQDAGSNDNQASAPVVVVFDNVNPSVEIQGAPSIVNSTAPFNLTFQFSEDVSGFVSGDISANNGTVSDFQTVDANTYTANINPDGNGDVTININATVAQDIAGNSNDMATQALVIFDNVSPTVSILNAPTIVNNALPFNVTFEFSEEVSGFVLGDISVVNGSADNFQTVDANTYTADITPDENGNITLNVPVNVAQDNAGNNNSAASPVTITFDNINPTVSIQNAPASVSSTATFNLTFEFSEDVSGFNLGGVSVTNGSANNLQSIDANTYTIDITPNGNGDITVSINAGSAQDGANNDNLFNQVTIIFQIIITSPEINIRNNNIDILSGTGAFDFGSLFANSNEATTVIFTIQNSGDGDLILNGSQLIQITGENASDFTISGDVTTNATISTLSQSFFGIQFQPSSAGTKRATISIANNDSDEGTYTFDISGTALEMSGPCNIPAGSFEQFKKASIPQTDFLSGEVTGIIDYSVPAGWSPITSLLFSAFGGTQINVRPTSDAFTGNTALEIFSSENGFGDALTTLACSEQPTALKGYYKFDGAPDDMATITVSTGEDLEDTENTETLTIAANAQVYTSFEIPLKYSSNSVNTITVFATLTSNTPGKSLKIDDVELLLPVTNQPPVVAGGTATISENTVTGTSVITLTAMDPDNDDLTFSITGGNTNNAFAIDPATGEITVNNTVALDFETTPSFTLTVTVSDGELSDTANITIFLTDQNEDVTEEPMVTGLGDELPELSITAYPNPTTGRVTLSSHELKGTEVNLHLIDMSGHLVPVRVLRHGAQEMVLDLDHLVSGTYLLRIETSNQFIIKRINKN